MDPGAVLQALLGHPNLCSRAWVTHAVRRRPSARTRSTAASTARPCCASRARRKALVMATDAVPRVGLARPVAGRGARRRRVHPQRRGHRRPAAGRHQLPQLRRSRAPGGVLAAPRGRPRPGRRVPGAGPAGHRRQRQPLQRIGARAHRADRQIGVVGLLDDIDRAGAAGRSGRPATSSVLLGEHGAGPGRLGLRRARRGGPGRPAAGPRPGPRAGPAGRAPRAPPARACCASAQDVSGGGLAVAIAECCHLGAASAPSSTLAVGATPAVELFGEAPSRVGRHRRAASDWRAPGRAGRRSRACRCERLGRDGGDRLRIRLVGRRRHRRRRGARRRRRRRRSTSRSPRCAHAWTARPAARALGEDGLSHVRRRRRPRPGPGGGSARRPRRCSRSSTVARSRPASRSATATA